MRATSELVRQEVLNLFCSQAARMPFVIIAGASLLAVFVFGKVPNTLTIGWLLLVLVVQLIRWWILPKLPDNQHLSTAKKLKHAQSLALLNGFVLGSCMMFIPFLSDIERLVVSSLLISVSVGAIGTTGGYRPLFLSFCLPLMGCVIIAILVSPQAFGADPLFYLVGMIYVLLTVIFIGLAREFHQGFHFAQEARLEKELANSQLSHALKRAEDANSSKTRFLASASHDLRQPIHTLSLFIASLKMRVAGTSEEEIVDHMQQAMSTIDGQLDSLLDISKLDSGVIQPSYSHFDLFSLIKRVVDMYEASRLSDRHSVPILVSCNAHGVIVNKDPQLTERILRNLIDNAVKYTHEGEINVDLKLDGDVVELAVSDTGVGMAPQDCEKIFEEFYQINNEERDRSRGLGLGLSIVNRLCALQDISIRVESLKGKGSRFTLGMQTTEPVATSTPAATASLKRNHAQHVLLLDNEPEVLTAMKTVLGDLGFRIEAHTVPSEAIRAAGDRMFDIALIDYRLSADINGLQVIDELRLINAETRFVLVTGDADIRLTHISPTLRPEIVYKPVTLDKLKELIG